MLDGDNNVTDVNVTNSYMLCNPNASCQLELDMQLELGLLLEQDKIVKIVPNSGFSTFHDVRFQLGMGLSLEPRPGLFTQHELRAQLDVALKLQAHVKLDPRIKVNMRFKLLLHRTGWLNSTSKDIEEKHPTEESDSKYKPL